MFQLVETPVALPGSCYLCGSGDKSPYIDWGVSIDFHGALYTCRECTLSVASLLGTVTREQHASLLESYNQLNELTEHLRNQNYVYRETIKNLEELGFGESVSNSDDQLSLPGTDLTIGVLAVPERLDESAREASELLDLGTGTLDEPSDDEGVDKLHSDDESTSYQFRI